MKAHNQTITRIMMDAADQLKPEWLRSIVLSILCTLVAASVATAQSPASGSNDYTKHPTMNNSFLSNQSFSAGFQSLMKIDEPSVNLYPNPVVDRVSIEFVNSFSDWYMIKLFSAGGRELESVKVTKLDEDKIIEFDMTKYATGQYIITVLTPSKAKSYRVYKQ